MTESYHVFNEARTHGKEKWICECGLSSIKEIPPCIYCGAEDGEGCKLSVCEMKLRASDD